MKMVEQENTERSEKMSSARLQAMHPLKQASLRISEFREGRSSVKARDLVGLLLSHGARAWRSSQPHSPSRIQVLRPEGGIALRMRFR